jgi:hypothetical protein
MHAGKAAGLSKGTRGEALDAATALEAVKALAVLQVCVRCWIASWHACLCPCLLRAVSGRRYTSARERVCE